MTVDSFFELFLRELKENRELWTYYKFLADPKKLAFRKAYFCQRLQYVLDNIGKKEQQIWDCGCGYGTTALFLAMNGYRVHGTTLEFYFRQIPGRKEYWKDHGDVSHFTCVYEDLFEHHYPNRFDTILLQDTLHHLEPVEEALGLLYLSLKNEGRLLIIEENGCNLVQNLKLWKSRGFHKKVETYDEILGRKVVFGNENIRCLKKWERILSEKGFELLPPSLEHIRFLPPFMFHRGDYGSLIRKEKTMAKRSSLLAGYFYFGINFIARKSAG